MFLTVNFNSARCVRWIPRLVWPIPCDSGWQWLEDDGFFHVDGVYHDMIECRRRNKLTISPDDFGWTSRSNVFQVSERIICWEENTKSFLSGKTTTVHKRVYRSSCDAIRLSVCVHTVGRFFPPLQLHKYRQWTEEARLTPWDKLRGTSHHLNKFGKKTTNFSKKKAQNLG